MDRRKYYLDQKEERLLATGLPKVSEQAQQENDTQAQAHQERTWYFASVYAHLVADYLKVGWMVTLPTPAHPVGDAYNKVPMYWPCSCVDEVSGLPPRPRRQ